MSTAEQIAVEALREIAKLDGHINPGVEIARKTLEQIDELNKPAVHNLSAADCVIDKPPGGGA